MRRQKLRFKESVEWCYQVANMNNMKSEIQQRFLDAAVQRAQLEILADVASGTVPADVVDFATLHSYVDANCYAGCCEESTSTELRGLDLWNAVFPHRPGDDEEVLGSEATLDALNEMQARVNHWLITGGHRQPVDLGLSMLRRK